MHEFGIGHSKVGIMPLELADSASDHCAPIFDDLRALYNSAIESQTASDSGSTESRRANDEARAYLKDQVEKTLTELESVAREDVIAAAVAR